MDKVCGTSGTELTRCAGRARGIESDRNHVFNRNAGFFSSGLEPVCDLLKTLRGPLLGKGRIFTKSLDKKLSLLIKQRIVDRSSAQIHPRHSFQNPLLGALTPRRATA